MLGLGMITGGATVTLGLGIRLCLVAQLRPWGIAGTAIGLVELAVASRWF